MPNGKLTQVALLRGINVGGKNKVPMKDLIEIFAATACAGVRTYIQSGNVIFNAAPGHCERLPDMITAQIAKRFGFKVPVVLRTAEQLGKVIRNNPFLKAGAAEHELHVMFLADAPSSRAVQDLDPDRSPPDAFQVRGCEIYLRLPNGAARTKLTNQYFDSKLATISTIRNWRTVNQLFAMMNDRGADPLVR